MVRADEVGFAGLFETAVVEHDNGWTLRCRLPPHGLRCYRVQILSTFVARLLAAYSGILLLLLPEDLLL